MGLLPILFLFYCSLSSAVPVPAIDVDCDSEGIFDGVDEALKSYNEAKINGNKFILYRITEAKIKQENDSLTHQFVDFEIQESVCPLKSATSWKQCGFKVEDAERGKCSAHILVNTEQNTKKVLSEHCAIIPQVVEPTVRAVTIPCLGCYHPIDQTSETFSTIIQSAMENVNRFANHPFYFELENVTKAERKVTSGWLYNLEFNIIQTNCLKNVTTNMNREDCTMNINGERGHCVTKVFLTPYGEVRDINSECYLSAGFCLHCPVHVDKDDPEIQTLIQKFLKQYNLQNHTNLYNVVNVTESTRILDAEKKQYALIFTIQPTNCSNSDHAILGDECVIEQHSNPVECKIRIDVLNETATTLPSNENCNMRTRMVTIKGFSPLRSVVPRRGRRAPGNSKGKEHRQNHEEGKHGKHDKKEKKHHEKKKEHKKKKDHEKKQDHSSEESEEEHRKKLETSASEPGFEFPRVQEKDGVTQQPIVAEEITSQTAMQLPAPAIPEFPSSSDSTTVPENKGTLTPYLSASTLATAFPQYTGTQPNINEAILEFPWLPPLNAPKCPSKVWQPLLVFPQPNLEEPFIIDGLLPAADDLAPPDDQSPPTDVYKTNLFTDEDLLSALDF